jgi:hypothetical protein
MADPLSLATGIVSVIALTTAASKALHRLIVSMRQAPEALLSLSNELADLAVVILEVKHVIDSGKDLPPRSRERLAMLLLRSKPKVDEIERLATDLTRAGSKNILNFSRMSFIEGKAKAASIQKDLRVFRLNIAAVLAANNT